MYDSFMNRQYKNKSLSYQRVVKIVLWSETETETHKKVV